MSRVDRRNPYSRRRKKTFRPWKARPKKTRYKITKLTERRRTTKRLELSISPKIEVSETSEKETEKTPVSQQDSDQTAEGSKSGE